MAIHTQTILIDDLDGSEAEETVLFGLDGDTFEIDLSTDNAQELRNFLRGYTEVSRKVTLNRKGLGRRSANGRRGSAGTGNRTAQIRAWAREEGLAVNSRGRIPAHIIAAFEEAHA